MTYEEAVQVLDQCDFSEICPDSSEIAEAIEAALRALRDCIKMGLTGE